MLFFSESTLKYFHLQNLKDYLMKLGLTDIFGEQRDLNGIIFNCPQIDEVSTFLKVNR